MGRSGDETTNSCNLCSKKEKNITIFVRNITSNIVYYED